MATDEKKATEQIDELRKSRQTRVDKMLNDDMVSQAPGNAAYFVGVLATCFVLNLLILIVITR